LKFDCCLLCRCVCAAFLSRLSTCDRYPWILVAHLCICIALTVPEIVFRSLPRFGPCLFTARLPSLRRTIKYNETWRIAVPSRTSCHTSTMQRSQVEFSQRARSSLDKHRRVHVNSDVVVTDVYCTAILHLTSLNVERLCSQKSYNFFLIAMRAQRRYLPLSLLSCAPRRQVFALAAFPYVRIGTAWTIAVRGDVQRTNLQPASSTTTKQTSGLSWLP
jgi:hypothetical protein